MAVKKTTKTSAKSAPKKAAPKQAAAKKSAAPKKAAAKKAPAKKKAAPVKLTDKQTDLLKKILETKEAGYVGGKGEAKVLESLQTKKLIKRGAKDKTSGAYRYTVSKAGQKHAAAPTPAPGA